MPLWADPNDALTVIELKHRNAEEMITVLRPIMNSDDSLVAHDNKLIMRTDQKTLDEIRHVINTLDKPLKNLIITVTNDRAGSELHRDLSVSGNISGEDAQVKFGERQNAELAVDYRHQARSKDAKDQFQLRVVEGQMAYIYTGESIPQHYHRRGAGPFVVAVDAGTYYQDLNTGFYVLPRVQGDTVSLEINPQREMRASNTDLHTRRSQSIETQSLHTTVTGRLGEWITIGGVDQSANVTDKGLVRRTRTKEHQKSTYYVKVEVAKD